MNEIVTYYVGLAFLPGVSNDVLVIVRGEGTVDQGAFLLFFFFLLVSSVVLIQDVVSVDVVVVNETFCS